MSDQFSDQAELRHGAGRDVVWRLLDGVGLEHCRFVWSDVGPVLSGIVITTDGNEPVTLEYSVHCDRWWHTREATININRASEELPNSLRLEADGDGHWWRIVEERRVALPELDGCLDVDIAVTPATNMLPVRRLDMAPGGKAEVTAAWVQFPSLEVSTLPQSYERFGARQYRYHSHRHDFYAVLRFDELGLITAYESLFERIAEANLNED